MTNRIFFGNGEKKAVIHRTPVRPGWVLYHAGDPPPPPNQIPIALDNHLTRDLQDHPQIRVLNILPIVQDGNTIAWGNAVIAVVRGTLCRRCSVTDVSVASSGLVT